jgi:centractin
MISGFPERFLGDIKKLLPKDARVKIWSPPERTTLCW